MKKGAGLIAEKVILVYSVVVTVGLLIVVSLLALTGGSKAVEDVPQIETTTLKQAIEKISELTTTKYYYSDIGKYENTLELNGWTIPFTQKDFILTFQGMASIGIDCTDIDIDVNVNESVITIQMPELKILSNVIDEASIEVYDEKTNVFNPISIGDYTAFAKDQKERITQKIQGDEIWQQAKENTKKALTELMCLNPQTDGMRIVVVEKDQVEQTK